MYLFIENTVEVSFIKARNLNTAAVLITFNLQNGCPYNNQTSLCTSTKTHLRYVISGTNTNTHTQDTDDKEYAEVAEKMTTKVAKLIISKVNLSLQTVEKDIWQGLMTVKWNKRVI